jgi:TPP-dependent indolepyruvate ferredoxin oxidoreductase alpha subunit
VDVVDPKNMEEFRTILEKRVNEDAFSVIISRHPCKLLRR